LEEPPIENAVFAFAFSQKTPAPKYRIRGKELLYECPLLEWAWGRFLTLREKKNLSGRIPLPLPSITFSHPDCNCRFWNLTKSTVRRWFLQTQAQLPTRVTD
jgi:hypothetical protein